MSKYRLYELIDLVLACQIFDYEHAVHIHVDCNGDHELYVYADAGKKDAQPVFYHCIRGYHDFSAAFNVYDPDFKQAETHIKRLLEEWRTRNDRLRS